MRHHGGFLEGDVRCNLAIIVTRIHQPRNRSRSWTHSL
jgi:hypothetical protein